MLGPVFLLPEPQGPRGLQVTTQTVVASFLGTLPSPRSPLSSIATLASLCFPWFPPFTRSFQGREVILPVQFLLEFLPRLLRSAAVLENQAVPHSSTVMIQTGLWSGGSPVTGWLRQL